MSDSKTPVSATAQIGDFHRSQESPGWFQDLRHGAHERFKATEWPTTSEEEWRRTSLRAFDFEGYALAAADDTTSSVSLPDGVAGRIVYRNGSFVSAALSKEALQAGVVLGDSAQLPDGAASLAIQSAIADAVSAGDNRIQHWQFSLLRGVASLYVPAGVQISEPIIVEISGDGDESVVAGMLAVVMEADSQATVVKRVGTGEDGELLFLDGEHLVVRHGARLAYALVQRGNDESLYFANGQASLTRGAALHRTETALGCDFVKTRFAVDLAAPDAQADLNGIYCGAEEQHLDMRTVQRHSAGRALSRAHYRGAVRDEAHSIYQGLIQVDRKADGTDSYLTNKNLVLSDLARADSIPSLNIKTDDVRCSHGSTTGKLNDDQVFYLQTRGYPVSEARRLLIQGHFEDLIGQMPDLVQDEVRDLLVTRLFPDE